MLDLSRFEKKLVISGNKGVSTQIYRRRIDGVLTVVEAIALSGLIERCQLETEFDNLLNMRDSMIAPLIRCVFPVE
jgi:hypothetical protein